jgi:hypothetical protein
VVAQALRFYHRLHSGEGPAHGHHFGEGTSAVSRILQCRCVSLGWLACRLVGRRPAPAQRMESGALASASPRRIPVPAHSTGLRWWLQGAPPAAGVLKLPVVLFSHGLAGQRAMYSISCSELASQGYLVLALEHADGTASAAQLAGGKVHAGEGGCRCCAAHSGADAARLAACWPRRAAVTSHVGPLAGMRCMRRCCQRPCLSGLPLSAASRAGASIEAWAVGQGSWRPHATASRRCGPRCVCCALCTRVSHVDQHFDAACSGLAIGAAAMAMCAQERWSVS